jgi:hypothetical protein
LKNHGTKLTGLLNTFVFEAALSKKIHKDTKGLNNANWHRRELSLQALLLFAEQVSGYGGKA